MTFNEWIATQTVPHEMDTSAVFNFITAPGFPQISGWMQLKTLMINNGWDEPKHRDIIRYAKGLWNEYRASERDGCPVEREFRSLLEVNKIRYTRPERDRNDPTTLDFYLTDLDLYVEIKQYHTDRIAAQLGRVPVARCVMVLQGRQSVQRFITFAKALAANRFAAVVNPVAPVPSSESSDARHLVDFMNHGPRQ